MGLNVRLGRQKRAGSQYKGRQRRAGSYYWAERVWLGLIAGQREEGWGLTCFMAISSPLSRFTHAYTLPNRPSPAHTQGQTGTHTYNTH